MFSPRGMRRINSAAIEIAKQKMAKDKRVKADLTDEELEAIEAQIYAEALDRAEDLYWDHVNREIDIARDAESAD
jgi:hypothetical protein